MPRYLPYLLPVFVSLVLISASYSGHFWSGIILFPFISFFTKTLGKFSLEEVIDEYIFFHHTAGMEIFRGISAVFFVGLNVWVAFFLYHHTLEWYNLFFFIYTVILLNSNFAISLAHDLMHSDYSINRAFGTVLLLINGFFYLETDHFHIHHRFVGTVGDPASAFRNESLYTYLKRSVSQRFLIIFLGNGKFTEELQREIRNKTLLRIVICISYLALSYLVSFQYFL
jgi:alkane 1-monooxygenase